MATKDIAARLVVPGLRLITRRKNLHYGFTTSTARHLGSWATNKATAPVSRYF